MRPVPDEIHVTVVDEDGNPVPNIVLLLTAMVGRKNDYGIGPKLTDEEGRAAFLRSELEDKIRIEKQHFPMDYAAGIEDVYAIRIGAFLGTEIGPLVRIREMWGQSIPEVKLSAEMRTAIENSSNKDYEGPEIRIRESQFEPITQAAVVLRRK